MPRLRRVMSSCGRSIVAGQSWRLVFRSGTVESQLGFWQTKHTMAAAAVYGDRRAVNAGAQPHEWGGGEDNAPRWRPGTHQCLYMRLRTS